MTLKIAVISKAVPFDGGSDSFEKSFSELLNNLRNEVKFIYIRSEVSNSIFSKSIYKVDKEFIFKINWLTKIRISLETSAFFGSLISRSIFGKSKIEKFFEAEDINHVIFLSPNPLALIVKNIPITSTVWDFGHRDLPELPEFQGQNAFLEREFYYSNTLIRSTFVLVDSEQTKVNAVNFYGVNPNRVIVLGLLPHGPTVQDKHKPIVDGKYLFYPAQFWSHKNHLRLLSAFKEISFLKPELTLVLTGSDKGFLPNVLKTIDMLNLGQKVKYLGFVQRDEYWNLLMNSECLVFPSLLGPTNLPPFEAAIVGKKMAISDFHETSMPKEINSISYFNPYSVASLRDGILQAIENSNEQSISFTDNNSKSIENLVSMIQKIHFCL